MKLVKIRFTTWRDHSVAPGAKDIQERHDEFSTRMSLLAATAARIRYKHAKGKAKEDQKSLAGIATARESVDAGRRALLSAEDAASAAEMAAARAHKKVGTFGYQIFNKPGTYVATVVDEAGNNISTQAEYTYDVVDDDPSLPAWAKKKFGH